jgi:hypothetical protein
MLQFHLHLGAILGDLLGRDRRGEMMILREAATEEDQ